MFAHQVIEDILEQKSKIESGKYYYDKGWKQVINNAIFNVDRISKAQKFHMGEIEDLKKIFDNKAGRQLFMDYNLLNLPYDEMWLDWTFKGAFSRKNRFLSTEGVSAITDSKKAALISKLSDGLWEINCFVYAEEYKQWYFDTSLYYIFVGGATPEKIKTWIEFPIMAEIKDDLSKIPKSDYAVYPFFLKNDPEDIKERMVKDRAYILSAIEDSIKLLNCKNIQTEKIPAPVNLNKKRIRLGKQSIFDYHILNLVLPSNKKRGYQEQTTPLSHNRVHLCRGHFKEYTKEHPLFGRLTGLYWWEPHVRGQNHNGIVMKDYNVISEKGTK